MKNICVTDFVKKHKEAFAIAAILTACYCLYFFSMGNYPLIDVDETRYVAMSRDMFQTKDFLTLYLNGDFFFEKPPLYFWFEALSFGLFGKITELTARIPVALTATFGVFLMYFLGRKISSKKYGMISALILASCFEYIVLARVAILDMLLCVCIATSVFSGIFTLFSSDNYKKYFWWLAYIFAGLGVMAKGIPGVAIPALTLFFVYLTAGKIKELFKPLYILPGLIFFLLITLPWHIMMLHEHGHLFYREYIYKHHIERFVNSAELGRKEPFYYFFGAFFVGFMPWIISFVSQIVVYLKKSLKKTKEYFTRFNDLQPLEQFMVINSIFFLVVFIFFSSASTKLPTYILPCMFPAAFITGKFWFDYIYKDENERAVNISTLILNFAFLGAAAALMIAPQFIREADRAGLVAMQIPGMILILTSVIVNSFAIFKDKKLLHFAALVSFMAILSMFSSKMIFPYLVSFGQDELIKYSQVAKKDNAELSSLGFGSRYSLMYYRDKKVNFLGSDIPSNENISKQEYVIVRNKRNSDFEKSYKYEIIEKGNKYSLYTNVEKKQ